MRISTLLALGIVFAGVTFPSQSPGQAESGKRRLSIDAQTASTINHVSALLLRAGLWGGIENYRVDCNPDLEFYLPQLNGTVDDALTQLTSQDNTLRWKVQDAGVLFTRHAPSTSLLDTRIGDFAFYRHDHAENATDKLLNLPAVRERMNILGATLRPPEIGFAQPLVQPKQSDQVLLRAANLRQALNAIARANHPRLWLYQQTSCGGEKTILVQWLIK